MRQLFAFAVLPLLPLQLLIGCADASSLDPVDDDQLGAETGVAALDDKADSPNTGELRVRTGDLTVWLKVRGRTDHEGQTGSRLIIEGRASRDLADAMSWIPDDAFGEVVMNTKRKFQVVFDEPHELNTVLSGSPVFLSLTSTTGTPRNYNVRFAVEPRFAEFKGSSAIFVRDAVLPIFVRDGATNLRFRGLATVNGTSTGFSVSNDDDSEPTILREDDTRYTFDWTPTNLGLSMTPTTDPVTFSAFFESGRTASKAARLFPMVSKLAITSGDPYDDLVVQPTCSDATRACIVAANGSDDLGACGVYRDVRVCLQAGPICGEDSPDLELFEVPIDVSANLAAFTAACPRGGSECGLDRATLYRLPECLEALPDVNGLATMVLSMEDRQGEYWPVLEDGSLEEILQVSPFSMASGAAGELLSTLGAYAGSFEARYWVGEVEVNCQNCHEWQVIVLAYYPSAGRLFVLRGGYFWDS